jgi:hypothetical protein
MLVSTPARGVAASQRAAPTYSAEEGHSRNRFSFGPTFIRARAFATRSPKNSTTEKPPHSGAYLFPGADSTGWKCLVRAQRAYHRAGAGHRVGAPRSDPDRLRAA